MFQLQDPVAKYLEKPGSLIIGCFHISTGWNSSQELISTKIFKAYAQYQEV